MNGHLYDVGPATDFPPGILHRIDAAGKALVLVHVSQGYRALRDTCPHQGARLSAGSLSGIPLPAPVGEPASYGRDGEIIVCPWHGWSFDTHNGRPLIPSRRCRVKTYPVHERQGRLLIEI
jgi:nitrite reductase (NADH) small subunit